MHTAQTTPGFHDKHLKKQHQPGVSHKTSSGEKHLSSAHPWELPALPAVFPSRIIPQKDRNVIYLLLILLLLSSDSPWKAGAAVLSSPHVFHATSGSFNQPNLWLWAAIFRFLFLSPYINSRHWHQFHSQMCFLLSSRVWAAAPELVCGFLGSRASV